MRSFIVTAVAAVALIAATGGSASGTRTTLTNSGIGCHVMSNSGTTGIFCFRTDHTGYILEISDSWVMVAKFGGSGNGVVWKHQQPYGDPAGMPALTANNMHSAAAGAFCKKDFTNGGIACIDESASGYGISMTPHAVLVMNLDTRRNAVVKYQ